MKFEMDALSALDDDLKKHWRSRPADLERIHDGIRCARERLRLPESEEERIAALVRRETARLRDPLAKLAFHSEYWKPLQALVAGDRLRLQRPTDEREKEAIVLSSGCSGGKERWDKLELAWLETGSDKATAASIEWVRGGELAGWAVRRAIWSDERLRTVELARQRSRETRGMPRECGRNIVVGDKLRWTEVVEPESAPSPDVRRPGVSRSAVVQFEGILVERAAEKAPWDDRCTVEVCWRSDGGPRETRHMSLGELTGRGCWRASWEDESKRRAESRAQQRELSETRRELFRQERQQSLSMRR